MKTYQETIEILNRFYSECLAFWKRENSETPEQSARADVANIKHDPFVPSGDLLDKQAILDFVEQLKTVE